MNIENCQNLQDFSVFVNDKTLCDDEYLQILCKEALIAERTCLFPKNGLLYKWINTYKEKNDHFDFSALDIIFTISNAYMRRNIKE